MQVIDRNNFHYCLILKMFRKLQHFSHVLDYITKKKIQIQKKPAEVLRC